MVNGFYDVDGLNLARVSELMHEAVATAYLVKCQSSKESWTRQTDETVTLKSLLSDIESEYGDFSEDRPASRNLAIVDRNVYYKGEVRPTDPYEIVLHNDNCFVYVYLSAANMDALLSKYGLKLRVWKK